MKLLAALKIFCLILLLLCGVEGNILELNSSKHLMLAEAVSEFISKASAQDISTADLIFGNSSDRDLKDFRDVLISKSFFASKVAIRQETAAKLRTLEGRLKRFTILLVDKFEDFTEIYARMSPNIFKFNGLYLVVLTSGEIPKLDDIFKLFWWLQIFNVNIIFEDINKTILVKTFNPFQAGRCNVTSSVIINQFKDGKFLTNVMFPDKMKNLHNCPIRVAVFNNSEPSVFVKRFANGSMSLSGSDISLVKVLSQSLNFKIVYTFVGFNVFFCENINSSATFKSTFSGQAEMSVSYWLLKVNCLKTFDITTSYFSDQIVFITPLGEELTFFEKLIYPFSVPLWASIIACFFIGSFVICIINRRSKVMQNFVFGTGNVNPYLNMVVGIIGGSQSILPRRNFARFLLMLYLMYCLVIRTLYQGSFFELLRSNKRYAEVQSVDEMIERNFKFYAQSGIAGLFQGSEAIRSRSKLSLVHSNKASKMISVFQICACAIERTTNISR